MNLIIFRLIRKWSNLLVFSGVREDETNRLPMRIYKTLFPAFVLFTLLLSASCGESAAPGCGLAGSIVHSVEEGEARISEDPDTGAKLIHYHVPGTIDSIWTGIICNESFPDFLIGENTRVRFSGDFREDNGSIEFNTRTGGQEFFYLDISFIEEIG